MPKKQPAKWITSLRGTIAGQFPRGWQVTEQSGKTKLTIKYNDGSRSSGMLPIAWEPGNSTQVLNSLASIRASI